MPEIIELLEDMVSSGEAPKSGCSLFGVGYEDGFERLKNQILIDRLKSKGKSAEKFVVGPYGSGKSHFMRQLMEIATSEGFATAEIHLSKKINISEPLIIYKEIANEIAVPEQDKPGVEGLIQISIERQRALAVDAERSDEILELWIDKLKRKVSFKNKTFQKILIKALQAYIGGEEELFENCCRWLNGDVTDSALSRKLDVSKMNKSESSIFADSAIFSLGQFIWETGFPGTIIGYDEAEQSTNLPQNKLNDILSMLRSQITAVTRIDRAALLNIYAFTPDVIQKMMPYAALQQRISDPNPEKDFFDGETFAPLIDLTRPFSNSEKSLRNLKEIGARLIDLFYKAYGDKLETPNNEVLANSVSWAEEISYGTASISNRRDMIKLCCSHLIEIYNREVKKMDVTAKDTASKKAVEEEV